MHLSRVCYCSCVHVRPMIVSNRSLRISAGQVVDSSASWGIHTLVNFFWSIVNGIGYL